MSYSSKALVAASVLLFGVPTAALAQQLPAGYIGVVQGNTPNTWQTYTYTYTPSTSGANFVGFAFRQDPAFWSFDNAALYAPGSTTNLFTNGSFTTGGSFSVTTNNGPSQIQAPTNWGVWYQNGTYPAAAGTWTNGLWYDGAVGTFDGIYQGVNLDAGTQYTISFDVSGNHTANNSSVQLGVYAGLCQDTTLAPAQCTIPSSYGFTTLATPAQGAAAGNPTPTVTGTSTTDQVTTSTSVSTRTETSYVNRTDTSTDSDGNPVVRTYTDTVVTTIPVTTVTTTTIPVTTTTYSDGSTTTSNGTAVVTTSSSDGTGTSAVTASALQTTAVTRQSVSYSYSPSLTRPVSTHNDYTFTQSESDGKQKVNVHVRTTVSTPYTTTITNTPVTTTTDSSGNDTITNGIPVETVVDNGISISYLDNYRNLYGRVDQLEVLDGINEGINSLLNHEPSQTKQKFRVFNKNYFVQSYNADGYDGKSQIYGGGFELDLSKGWTIGGQYNNIQIDLVGVDSISKQNKEHYGIFNSFHGNTLSLITNAAMANSTYDIQRTVENVFYNRGQTTGKEWWISNRLYWHVAKWISPFVGYTVHNMTREGYTEQWYPQSARTVDPYNQTNHVGEAGLKLETRFGGKKKDLFGVSVDGAYGTDNSYGVTASVDYKQMVFVEGSHSVNNGVTNNSIAGKVKFRF